MNKHKGELMAGLKDANRLTMSMEIAVKTASAIKKLRRAERSARKVLQWARARQAKFKAQGRTCASE